MLLEESLWFKSIIHKYVKNQSLVLNIGSSTKHFIEVEQPYIKTNLIDELYRKECQLKNIDIRNAEGVDIIGDVTDNTFIDEINALLPDVIICSNLLEHLENRQEFCNGIMRMMSGSTILIISVPYSFPYHEDPIDTLFRPDIEELKTTFNKLDLIEGKIVRCGMFYSYYSRHTPYPAKLINFVRISLSLAKAFFINKARFKNNLWYFKKISASCAVFKLS